MEAPGIDRGTFYSGSLALPSELPESREESTFSVLYLKLAAGRKDRKQTNLALENKTFCSCFQYVKHRWTSWKTYVKQLLFNILKTIDRWTNHWLKFSNQTIRMILKERALTCIVLFSDLYFWEAVAQFQLPLFLFLSNHEIPRAHNIEAAKSIT